ncbi:hypothetical protein E8E15_007362 [Penicillium rubens]|uniref:Pc22g01540 protein n=2 Tax=Penicillium chrysogenum species complex TaxID=254878 RepID=B6HPK8_PENRW|nr:uncharacterized protein N7525_006036 [Penicillium rubens]KZN86126.1 putative membrane protein [Penicillium chrysogenum]CAP97442.1 Pc22g01540 [Penicillium rubens Wisconsin 54-1255]KAF3029770.1 hypothetical protein E8E15_007362 [Penicillium rubens]KAJ5043346.1 hypothetical protein NUH16_000135 [Penicillium rubens]KAJ5840848.1 hypothetical protein N7525_006036 [Penicillium rubens]
MPLATRVALVATFTLFLASLATAIPHGDDESMDMGMDMNAGTNAPQPTTTATQATTDGPMSYFAYSKHSSTIIAHIALMVLGWCFVLPVAVMLSIARSWLALPSQFLFLGFNAFGVLLGVIYNNQTPDLYENNAHHKIGWIATCVVSAQVVLALLFAYAGRGKSNSPSYEHATFLPVATDDDTEHACLNGAMRERRWSRDSGQGTDSNSSSIRSPGSSCGSPTEYDGFEKPEELPAKVTVQSSWIRHTAVGRFLSKTLPGLMPSRVLRVLNVVYNVVDRVILPFGFTAIATGAVTYGGIMRDREIFNGLAHFIKGGIFFWYGILTLGRYIGCWADLGWAWNKKPSASIVGWKSKVPSGEATESFVIFLYGATNVFLEHLSNAGKAWSATDLEHVSISVLFFGGGLAGMLFESTRVRDWVNKTILEIPAHDASNEAWTPPRSQGVSLNPMPALVIMLLGMMMGSHHQTSMTSTMVHKQWGNMLVGFALARGMTYVLLYLKPPTSYLPARPPTEIIAAFCLISGGLIFMMSTRNVIEAMEYYELDAMFTFTVGLGFSAFIMAYEILTIAIKAWAVKRAQRSRPNFRFQ